MFKNLKRSLLTLLAALTLAAPVSLVAAANLERDHVLVQVDAAYHRWHCHHWYDRWGHRHERCWERR
jgi:hypothetical protein